MQAVRPAAQDAPLRRKFVVGAGQVSLPTKHVTGAGLLRGVPDWWEGHRVAPLGFAHVGKGRIRPRHLGRG